MNFSKEIIEKAKTASSAEELFAMAKELGFELPAEDAEKYFCFMNGKGVLSDEELEQVAGGKGANNIYKYCKYCKEETSMRYLRDDVGWDSNGKQHKCHLWDCYKCGNTNYYDVNTGRLI